MLNIGSDYTTGTGPRTGICPPGKLPKLLEEDGACPEDVCKWVRGAAYPALAANVRGQAIEIQG
jgi:hypothetical protein